MQQLLLEKYCWQIYMLKKCAGQERRSLPKMHTEQGYRAARAAAAGVASPQVNC
jgi:hypothetical protein